MTKYNILVATLVLSCLLGVAYSYSNCGSKGTINSVTVSDCPDLDKKCILKRNTNVSIAISFTPTENTNSVKAVVHGVILSVPMPFELPNPDGCKNSGLECPLKAGQTYKYVSELPVSSNYPRLTVDVKWELRDDEDNDLVCIEIPSKIK